MSRRPTFARIVTVLAVATSAGLPAPAHAGTIVVETPALRASVTADPWTLRFDGPAPQAPLEAATPTGTGPVGSLGFRTADGWRRATRVQSERREGTTWVGTLATTDPAGRTITVRLSPVANGLVRLAATVDGDVGGVQAIGGSFLAPPGERHLGFGERANAVDHRGGEVENYVADGPYQPIEDPFVGALVPPPGVRPRPDATYFPIPWLLSSRGIGALVENDEVSTFRLGNDDPGAWSFAVNASAMRLLVVAGPTPARVLTRFTAHVGRQPPAAAPFYFGPWWQAKGSAADNIKVLREAGAAGSVLQTYTHYLPCGDQQGREATGERQQIDRAHAAGLAITTYFNPMICTSYTKRFQEAQRRGVLTKHADGSDYTYDYQGSTRFSVGQVDFTHPDGPAFYGDLLDEAVRAGYDGWMEDFGEYTPLDALAHDGGTGELGHNAYVRQYHAAARLYARTRAPKPLARFNRSGFTGSVKESQIVWGGDPTTDWGFDGLRSVVTGGLSMGLSGVSLWGSDIGGFFALSAPQTTAELLNRWIEVGFASGVMRTQANGFDLQDRPRAQIFDADVLPVWRRYARLRTQFYPYLAAAEKVYDATGLPLMRHLALAYPDDAQAVTRDDQYLLGADLLVAPVLDPGRTSRPAYLPAGDWIDWWRSVELDDRVAPQLAAPRILSGGETRTVPAAIDELPLLVRVGTMLPLLDPSVDTLTAYGKGATVRLADRRNRLRLLAWPRGVRTFALGPDRRDRATSSETRRGWVLKLRQGRKRNVEVQVALSTLRAGAFLPCRVLGGRNGRVLLRRGRAWFYDQPSGVLRIKLKAKDARVQVLRRC